MCFVFFLKHSHDNKRGDDAKAPYLFNGSTFISYDDPESIRLKCAYLKKEGLLGIMYWEHGCDPSRRLLTAMAGAMRHA